MKITLKNVKFYSSLSQETNCFTASIYVDEKLVGTAENQGHGGNTHVGPELKNKEIYYKAEKWLSTQPKLNIGDENEPFFIDSNMENIVDNLFEKWLLEQEYKKLSKKFVNHLVWEVKGIKGNFMMIKYSMNLIDFIKHPKGLETLKTRISLVKSEGHKIINDNLGNLI